MNEDFVSIKLSRKKDTFRGPYFIPPNLRQYIPDELRVEVGIVFPDRKLKFELPRPLVIYLLKTVKENFDE